MMVEIPDECECGDDFVCSKCTWETACALVSCSEAFNKIAREVPDDEED